MNKVSKLMEETSYQEIDNDGTIHFKNEKGEFHRENGPAIIWSNGDKQWYLNGKIICFGFDIDGYDGRHIGIVNIFNLSTYELEKYKIIIIQICINMSFGIARMIGFESVAEKFIKIYNKTKWDELKTIIDYCLYASKMIYGN